MFPTLADAWTCATCAEAHPERPFWNENEEQCVSDCPKGWSVDTDDMMCVDQCKYSNMQVKDHGKIYWRCRENGACPGYWHTREGKSVPICVTA